MGTMPRFALKRPLQLGFVAVMASMLAFSCSKKAPDAQSEANDKRWSNFQKANKRDIAIGMSAFERRQTQLAATKKKASAGTTVATPSAAAPNSKQPESR